MYSNPTFTIQICPLFTGDLEYKINDSPNKASRWPTAVNKMDMHLYIFSINCPVITTGSSYLT